MNHRHSTNKAHPATSAVRRSFWGVLPLSTFVLLFAVCSFAIRVQSQQLPDQDLRRSAIVRAVEEAGPAVVNINTERVVTVNEGIFPGYGNPFSGDPFFRRFFEPNPRQYRRTSLGSGVIISPEGYILTNQHVIASSTKITVTLMDGREFVAQPIGAVSAMDLAILKIDDDKPLPAIRAGTSSDLMIGETVIAIGNPFGLSNTVTTGVISALHRSIRADQDRVYSDFIQIDASINPGNSGGPLMNINGDLIGINTAIFDKAEGIGFALPINKALRVVDDLIKFGEVKQGFIGIRVQDLDEDLAHALGYMGNYGVVVTSIDPKSPADGSGLERGDVIYALDKERATSVLEFDRLLKEFPIGTELVVYFHRGEKKGSVKLRMGDFPKKLLTELPWKRLGIRTSKLDRSLAAKYKIVARQGLVVTKVRQGGIADRTGIQPGDVLLRIDNQPLLAKQDLVDALRKSFYKTSAFIIVQRGSLQGYRTVPLE